MSKMSIENCVFVSKLSYFKKPFDKWMKFGNVTTNLETL